MNDELMMIITEQLSYALFFTLKFSAKTIFFPIPCDQKHESQKDQDFIYIFRYLRKA